MSLRTLARSIHGTPAIGGPPTSNTALMFVLNSAFLRPFHALIYSLAKIRTLTKYPIVIISEDSRVFRDPLVRLVADRTVVASEETIAEFANISAERVRHDLRMGWIAKYTFLKWLVFQDYGFDQHIYIDADIIALGDCEALTACTAHDLYGAPVFKRSMIVDDQGARLPLAERTAKIEDFLVRGAPKAFNSGVMVINRRAMEPAFRQGLIATAEARPYSVEQAVIRDFVSGSGRYTMGALSSAYNFNHGFLAAMPVHRQIELLLEIRLLHFVGADKKPWNADYAEDPDRVERLSDTLWTIMSREVRATTRTGLLASRRLDRLEARARRRGQPATPPGPDA